MDDTRSGRGVFITFEGPDGCGKSTQASRLAQRLQQFGIDVVATREPGGTPLGRRLRQLLLEKDEDGPVPVVEMLLLAADRAQHVRQLIRPALQRGAVVLSDRYIDSSIAYQAGGLGLPEADVRKVNVLATDGLLPDLTILLDMEPEAALRRKQSGPVGEDGAGLDRIEGRGLLFQERVLTMYRRLAALETSRWVRLEVMDLSVDEVAANVWAAVTPVLRKAGIKA